jgi:membrane fusion protein, multidrug efflux system
MKAAQNLNTFLPDTPMAVRLLSLSCLLSSLLLAPACSRSAQALDHPKATEVGLAVQTVAAVEQPMPTFLTVTGSLTSNRQSEVAAGTSGKVVKTFVERGSLVPANTLLVQLDARSLSHQAEESQANLEVAKRQRTLADAECERSDKLFKTGAVSRDEFDKAKANCESARFQATAAEAHAEQALVGVNDSQIRAPFAGLIAERYVQVGEYVQPPTKVASLVELDPLRLELSVPEASLQLVKEGMDVVFSTATDPGVTFKGTVRYIGPSVRTSSRDLVVEAVVPNPDHRLRPGQFVAAKLVLGDKSLPTVPQLAVHPEGNLRRIYVVYAGDGGNRLEERLVELGEARDEQVAVVSGLRVGEKVVTKADGDLRDGAKVRGL